MILDSIDAYNVYHNFYNQITSLVRATGNSTLGFAAKIVITYGSMRMTVNGLPHDPYCKAAAIQWFVQEMIRLCIVGLVYGAYEIAVKTARGTIWVVLQVIESEHMTKLIT